MADLSDFIESSEIKQALETDDEVMKGKLSLAFQACAYWQSIAPVEQRVRPLDRPAGTYRDSIHVEVHGKDVVVKTNDPIAHMIEYGTVKMHEFACRARTEKYFKGKRGEV